MNLRSALTVLLFAAVLHATGCAAVGVGGSSNHELRAEKNGRIVDADTGQGIADVNVIANWEESFSGAAHIASAGSWCVLQKIVKTDQDGRFTLPDVGKELDLSDRGTRVGVAPPFGVITSSNDFSWKLILYKPGYVRVGKDFPVVKPEEGNPYNQWFTWDDRKVLDHRINGDKRACLPDQGCMPSFAWETSLPDISGSALGHVSVQPIGMKKVELAPPALWLYYGTILSKSQCYAARKGDLNQPEIAEMEHSTSTLVRPMPCMMPPAATITAAAATSYAGLVGGKEIFTRIEKFGETTWPWKDTTAEVLCKASRVEEQAP